MIGIIILNYNSWLNTEQCISSIRKSCLEESYKIYLVDNASSTPITQTLKLEICLGDIIFIRNDKNLGYSAGNNIGAKKALADKCDYLLFCNNDIYFKKNAIQIMADFLTDKEMAGIVGPKIINYKGKTQKNCICMKTGIKEKYIVRTKAHIFFPKLNSIYWGLGHNYDTDDFRVYAVLGCCFMMTRSCALKVLPFDEKTFLYEEELILGIRMEELSEETWYTPKCTVIHQHGGSTNKVKEFAFRCNVESEIYYCRHYLKMSLIQIYPLYLYRCFSYLLRCLIYKEYRININEYFRLTGKKLRQGEN